MGYSVEVVQVLGAAERSARAEHRDRLRTIDVLAAVVESTSPLGDRFRSQWPRLAPTLRQWAVSSTAGVFHPVPTGEPLLTSACVVVALDEARRRASDLGDQPVQLTDLVVGLVKKPTSSAARALLSAHITCQDVEVICESAVHSSSPRAAGGGSASASTGPPAEIQIVPRY